MKLENLKMKLVYVPTLMLMFADDIILIVESEKTFEKNLRIYQESYTR